MRTRISTQPKSSLVISARGRIVFARESAEVTKKIVTKQREKIAKQKRHDDFMAIGGTRELLDYSNNVQAQILAFKQKQQQEKTYVKF